MLLLKNSGRTVDGLMHHTADDEQPGSAPQVCLSTEAVTVRPLRTHAGENNVTIDFPIIADPTREISVKYGMLDPTIKVPARDSAAAGPAYSDSRLLIAFVGRDQQQALFTNMAATFVDLGIESTFKSS